MTTLAHRTRLLLAAALAAGPAFAQTALDQSFTYQGRLENAAGLANGPHDMQFELFAAAAGGAQVGPTLCLDGVDVLAGLFGVALDFGPVFDGNQRFLQVRVRQDATPANCDSGAGYTLLTPRQAITATPYALKVLGVDGHSLDAADGSPTDVVYVDATGDVGVGTLSPSAGLHVKREPNTPAGTLALEGTTHCFMSLFPDGAAAGRKAFFGFPSAASNSISLINEIANGEVWLTTVGGRVVANTPRLELTSAGKSLALRGDGGAVDIESTTSKLYLHSSGASGNNHIITQPFGGEGNVGVGTEFPSGKLHAYSDAGRALVAQSFAANVSALYAEARANTGAGTIGVEGVSYSDAGGTDTSAPCGVYGAMALGGGAFSAGVRGANYNTSSLGVGLLGYHNGSGWAVYGRAANVASGYAGFFSGRVSVTGNLSKGGGSFKIDHPLDPANKYLYHSFVESPDMMNLYNGNVTTDLNGVAEVTLPEWFGALNRDFRYQLTVIGQFAQAMVASEIAENRFTIRTDKPGVKVSWLVTGIRQDAYANANRIPIEEAKPAAERGRFIHPEAFGLTRAQSVELAQAGSDENAALEAGGARKEQR